MRISGRFLAGAALTAAIACFGCGEPRPGSGISPLRFDREVVRLRVDRDTLEVEGIYGMTCASARTPVAFLFYPYPRESGLGEARTLLVECRGREGPWRPLPFLERPSFGARWTVPLDLGDTLVIRTVYRQALHGTRARYIVSTTRDWDRPLTRARFEIRLPDGAEPIRFSHAFAPEPGPEGTVYVYEAEDFWPDRDITVTWRP